MLPWINAGASFQTGIATGKFQGVMSPTTPSGRRRVYSRWSGTEGSYSSPIGRHAWAAANPERKALFDRLQARELPADLADECRAMLWRDAGVDPDDPATWTKPVIRLGMYGQPPFRAAANTPLLQFAYDQLVGRGRWVPPQALGTRRIWQFDLPVV